MLSLDMSKQNYLFAGPRKNNRFDCHEKKTGGVMYLEFRLIIVAQRHY